MSSFTIDRSGLQYVIGNDKQQQFRWAALTFLALDAGANKQSNQHPIAACFDTVGLASERASSYKKKLMDVYLAYLCIWRWFARGHVDTISTISSLASLKPRMVYFPFATLVSSNVYSAKESFK